MALDPGALDKAFDNLIIAANRYQARFGETQTNAEQQFISDGLRALVDLQNTDSVHDTAYLVGPLLDAQGKVNVGSLFKACGDLTKHLENFGDERDTRLEKFNERSADWQAPEGSAEPKADFAARFYNTDVLSQEIAELDLGASSGMGHP
jgi:hypothetical protein